jgi:hypothetical protein
MMTPLEEWICDVCGEIIESPENAYVIWKDDQEKGARSFKIIHHGRCDLKDHGSSMPLSKYLGKDGLTHLLAFWSVGPIKEKLGIQNYANIKNDSEFVDFVRRVQIPYYEEDRQYFYESDVIEKMSDANEVFPYQPDILKEIVEEHEDA